MSRILFFAVLMSLITFDGFCQHGLEFNSHEVVLEKRTSLDLSPKDSICFEKDFELRFDINFIPNSRTYFGYVVRMISNGSHNIDLLYDQETKHFKVVAAESFTKINFTVDSARLYKQWNSFSLKFNLENQTLDFSVNGKSAGTTTLPIAYRCFRFLWGANDYEKFKTKDIPHMQIKDIRIYEANVLKYFWPLDEIGGVTEEDRINRQTAKIKNAVWIRPRYQQWQLLNSFVTNGCASVAFDSKNDRILVAGADSLVELTLRNDKATVKQLPTNHMNFRLGHQAIYDTLTGKLYDFFIDQKKILEFNFNKNRWQNNYDTGRITAFWHANKFISSIDSSLYVVGGYGRLKYKNLIQRYSFATNNWELINPRGDYFPPRYLAALGLTPDKQTVYIIGGYGSLTGDQMLDPSNQFDLLRYDIHKKTFRKLYTFPTTALPFTFANSLIVGPKADEFYGLVFANDSSNSNLQLVKGNLDDSSLNLHGGLIPYKFHDIESFADLYYSSTSNKLIAVVMHYSGTDQTEKSTDVKIYSLNFPPELISTEPDSMGFVHEWKISALILMIFATATFILFRSMVRLRHKRKFAAARNSNPVITGRVAPLNPFMPDISEKTIVSSIFLFGHFQVFDKKGKDITGLFSPLLKELFLMICINTIRRGTGISSNVLNERLWHDKSDKDAKNNRSVNIAKLKVILEKIGNCVVNKDSGSWQFHILSDEVSVDYKNFISLIQYAKDPAYSYIVPLVEIIHRGGFLSHTEYEWLDDIKSEVSGTVIDICLAYLKGQDITKDPEFVIEVANRIFYFDQLNEDALAYKCKALIHQKRLTLANTLYLKFFKDYKEIYGTDYNTSFSEVVS